MLFHGTRKETGKIIKSTTISTPLGNMVACAIPQGICLLEFEDRPDLDKQLKSLNTELHLEIAPGDNKHFPTLQNQLDEYFNRDRTEFDLTLKMVGTDFQKKVWSELLKIPYGKSMSYMDLTVKLGDKKAIRAVASANGANKIAILIPCHRIVGSDGRMVGYAGGVSRKNRLLSLESGQVMMTL
jgi:AraC family transcriptional regulator of adaptative response/methylated-DNA-[protein]-cysteine methyltransferase